MDFLGSKKNTIFIGQAVEVPGTAMSKTLIDVPKKNIFLTIVSGFTMVIYTTYIRFTSGGGSAFDIASASFANFAGKNFIDITKTIQIYKAYLSNVLTNLNEALASANKCSRLIQNRIIYSAHGSFMLPKNIQLNSSYLFGGRVLLNT